MAYAENEGPDQTAHLRSLIWAFVTRFQNQYRGYCIIEPVIQRGGIDFFMPFLLLLLLVCVVVVLA